MNNTMSRRMATKEISIKLPQQHHSIKRKKMKPSRLFVILSTLVVALGTVAQERPDPVEAHLKLLTQKLELTGQQQTKAKSISQEMSNAEGKIRANETFSNKERLEKVRPIREKADKKLRRFLTDKQRAKLDQVERQPHDELHGGLSGSAQN